MPRCGGDGDGSPLPCSAGGRKPTQVEILLVRYQAFLVEGKVAEGSSDAASAMELLPPHQDALLALAESKLAEGELEESADVAERLNNISSVLRFA